MMRTSPTDPRGNGFTLVELLIVLTILGLVSATVVLAMPGEEAALREEAERLAARAHAAQEQAVVSVRPVALRMDAQGYGFMRRGDGTWQPVAEPPLAPHRFPAGIEAAADTSQTIFDPTGMSEPAEIALTGYGRTIIVSVNGSGGIHVRAAS